MLVASPAGVHRTEGSTTTRTPRERSDATPSKLHPTVGHRGDHAFLKMSTPCQTLHTHPTRKTRHISHMHAKHLIPATVLSATTHATRVPMPGRDVQQQRGDGDVFTNLDDGIFVRLLDEIDDGGHVSRAGRASVGASGCDATTRGSDPRKNNGAYWYHFEIFRRCAGAGTGTTLECISTVTSRLFGRARTRACPPTDRGWRPRPSPRSHARTTGARDSSRVVP